MRVLAFSICAWLVQSPTLLLQSPTPVAFDRAFTTDTMRVDYFHTGGPKAGETISLDRVMNDGPWAGSRTQLVDPTELGKYRFEVRDEFAAIWTTEVDPQSRVRPSLRRACPQVLHLRRHGQYRVEAVGLASAPVRSMGGIRVLPSALVTEVDPADVAAFILPGGDRWESSPVEPEIEQLLSRLMRSAFRSRRSSQQAVTGRWV
jgi:hypothetical protein